MLDERLHVIALERTQCLGVNVPASRSRKQRPGRTMLGLDRFGDEDIDAQLVAIFHEYMSAVAEPCRLAVALSHEAGLGGRCALMSGVRALLVLEVGHLRAIVTVIGRVPSVLLTLLDEA